MQGGESECEEPRGAGWEDGGDESDAMSEEQDDASIRQSLVRAHERRILSPNVEVHPDVSIKNNFASGFYSDTDTSKGTRKGKKRTPVSKQKVQKKLKVRQRVKMQAENSVGEIRD